MVKSINYKTMSLFEGSKGYQISPSSESIKTINTINKVLGQFLVITLALGKNRKKAGAK